MVRLYVNVQFQVKPLSTGTSSSQTAQKDFSPLQNPCFPQLTFQGFFSHHETAITAQWALSVKLGESWRDLSISTTLPPPAISIIVHCATKTTTILLELLHNVHCLSNWVKAAPLTPCQAPSQHSMAQFFFSNCHKHKKDLDHNKVLRGSQPKHTMTHWRQ